MRTLAAPLNEAEDRLDVAARCGRSKPAAERRAARAEWPVTAVLWRLVRGEKLYLVVVKW